MTEKSSKERRRFSLIPKHESQSLLPITCRFVSSDQWLISHVDVSWRILDVKNWLLRKCNVWGADLPQPPKFRPASPVTFASRSSSDSIFQDDLEEEDDDDDWDSFTINHKSHQRAMESSSAEKSSTSYSSNSIGKNVSLDAVQQRARKSDTIASKFSLFSFSNGNILDDDACLSWYNFRPYEMLELHRCGKIVQLSRHNIDYVEPYFDSPVFELDSYIPQHEIAGKQKKAKSAQPNLEKQQAEWKKRWVVIHDGTLYLHKEEVSAPLQRYPISNLCSLSGSEQLGPTISSHQHIVCAKFYSIPYLKSKEGASLRQENSDVGSSLQKLQSSKNGTWVVLSMPDESSLANIIRVLHRLAPYPISSSFIPAPTAPTTPVSSPPSTPSSSSSPSSLDQPAFAVEYPEWRIFVVARAHKAGLGDLSPAMAHALYGAEEDEPQMRNPSHKNNWSTFAPGKLSDDIFSDNFLLWGENDVEGSDSEADSEVEWEGWARDLSRRSTRSDPRLNRAAWVRSSSSAFAPPPEPPPRETIISRVRVSSTPAPVGFHVTTTTTTHVTTLSSSPGGLYNISPISSTKIPRSHSDVEFTPTNNSPGPSRQNNMKLSIPDFTIPERRSEDALSESDYEEPTSPLLPDDSTFMYHQLGTDYLNPGQVAERIEKSLRLTGDG